MKKVLLLFTILIVSVMTTACINNLAIQELNNKAADYMDKGDTESAICRLKSSLDLDNEMYQTHYNLAVAYNNVNEYEQSIEECKKVLELKPDYYDAYYTMAVAKEALAYQYIEKEDEKAPSGEDIEQFTNLAQDAIDTFNEYLTKKIDAEDTEQINGKITELNEKIKEYTLENNTQPQQKSEGAIKDQQPEQSGEANQ